MHKQGLSALLTLRKRTLCFKVWSSSSRRFAVCCEETTGLKGSQDLEEVLKVFNKQNGIHRLFCSSSNTCSLSYKDVDAALQTMPINWHSLSLVRSVIKYIRDPPSALNFLFWVIDQKGYRPSTADYNAVLESLGFARMFFLMHMVIDHMEKTRCKFLPSTFTILIKHYGKAGLADEATKVLAQMKRYGISPNVQTYNHLIHVSVQKRQLAVAYAIYRHMLSCGITTNEYTVTFLVDGFSNEGRFVEAWQLIKSGRKMNIYAYNVLLKGFCKAQKVEEGCKLLEEIIGASFSPDEYTYNTLIVAACKSGKLDLALELYQSMLDNNVAPTIITYGTIIIYLCKNKRVEEAFELLVCMRTKRFTLNAQDQASLYMAFFKTSRRACASIILKEIINGP